MFWRGCSKRTMPSFRNFPENFTNSETARPCLCSNRGKESKTSERASISSRRKKIFLSTAASKPSQGLTQLQFNGYREPCTRG